MVQYNMYKAIIYCAQREIYNIIGIIYKHIYEIKYERFLL